MTNESGARQRWFSRGLVLLVYLAVALPVMASFSQRQKITSVPRGVGAQFGYAVAVSGNTMVVGARFDGTTAASAGSAFVYVLSGTNWTQQAGMPELFGRRGAVLNWSSGCGTKALRIEESRGL